MLPNNPPFPGLNQLFSGTCHVIKNEALTQAVCQRDAHLHGSHKGGGFHLPLRNEMGSHSSEIFSGLGGPSICS